MRNTRDNTSKGLTVIKHMSNISIPGLQNRPIIKLFIKYTKRSLLLTLTSPGLTILIWDFPNIPRNENFNLLVRIKFLNLFLYTVVLNKNEIIYWSQAGGPVLSVRTPKFSNLQFFQNKDQTMISSSIYLTQSQSSSWSDVNIC